MREGAGLQQVYWGRKSAGLGGRDPPCLPWLTARGRGEWPRRALSGLTNVGLSGPRQEAGPLTLNGGLAGLAHELIDGGQGLWLALQGETGHMAQHSDQPVPVGVGAGAGPVPPGSTWTPDTGHSPSLLAPLWAPAAPVQEEKEKPSQQRDANPSRSGWTTPPTPAGLPAPRPAPLPCPPALLPRLGPSIWRRGTP